MINTTAMLALLSDAYSVCYGVVNALLIRLEYPAVTCAIYLAFELLMPRTRNSARSYLHGSYFVATAVLINTLVLTVAQATTGVQQNMPGMPGASQLATLFSLDLARFTNSDDLGWRVFGWLVATLGIGVLADFFYYWMHRAQHTFSWLWRFHKVHHSITDMSATNSYHHVAEDLFQYVAVTLPLTFLLGVSAGPVPWLLIAVVNTHTYFIHSSANFNIGPQPAPSHPPFARAAAHQPQLCNSDTNLGHAVRNGVLPAARRMAGRRAGRHQGASYSAGISAAAVPRSARARAASQRWGRCRASAKRTTEARAR
jgi:sterol desaturase/sphingolipid hydroxylase (fatty acid hydroxylase superfamily)